MSNSNQKTNFGRSSLTLMRSPTIAPYDYDLAVLITRRDIAKLELLLSGKQVTVEPLSPKQQLSLEQAHFHSLSNPLIFAVELASEENALETTTYDAPTRMGVVKLLMSNLPALEDRIGKHSLLQDAFNYQKYPQPDNAFNVLKVGQTMALSELDQDRNETFQNSASV